MSQVLIPYTPREVQRDIHKRLDSSRFSVLVAHRRMGKTVLAVNHLIKEACTIPLERAVFAYVAPYRNQAEQIAWAYLKHYTSPITGTLYNEQKLSVTLPNGSTIRIFGADNPDALRGLYFDGVILDEVAQMRPSVWEEIIRPALADRKGWAVFIGTPKGANLFQELYLKAKAEEAAGNKSWCAMLYRVTDTHAIDDEELESLRREMSENRFAQEFLCDFNASAEDILIPVELVDEAQRRTVDNRGRSGEPLIMGVDVARFGDDASVITFRQGSTMEEQIAFHNLSTMELTGRITALVAEKHPSVVFVDGVGVGAGVVDRLRELGVNAVDAQAGARALDPKKYLNRRAEMWVQMRDWLRSASIPADAVLFGDLTALTYSYNSAGVLVLERKEEAKERLKRSPDRADSLALTFYAPVFTDAMARPTKVRSKYNPLEW